MKGRARAIPPLVIVAWTQGVAGATWAVYFLASGRPFVPPGGDVWSAIVASWFLVLGMSGLLARASARGDISIVGPILALSPLFTILPDAALSGGLPSALGWLGLGLSLAGTVSLSGGAGGRLVRLRLVGRMLDGGMLLAGVHGWAALWRVMLIRGFAAGTAGARTGERDDGADDRADERQQDDSLVHRDFRLSPSSD